MPHTRAPLSPHGLATLHELMAAHVAARRMPGLVTLVARGDDVHVDVVGTPAFDDPEPLRRDAIFRIASLSKPIAAATAMSLVDEGLLRLDQPIDDLVPELADRRVLRAIDAELDDTVPAERSITVEDLLSYRMGVGSVMAPPGTHPFQRAEAALGLQSIGGPPWPPVAHDSDQWIAALGSLPLLYQPGERWLYNTSGQVLGVLVARAAGKPLGEVMHERIFEPLAMADTGFAVPAAKLHRLTSFYMPNGETGEPSLIDDPSDSWWSKAPRFPDASGWLVSTIDDLWTFVSMLLAGGSLRGARIVSERSVALMTSDRLTPAQRADAGVFLGTHAGWGLGMEVPATGSADEPLPHGFGWDGGSGTSWRSNSARGVTGILLTQRQLTSPQPPAVYDDFWAGVNAATGAVG
jgi:CubicO group peptidase (beta-lactamase class C family)